MKEFHDLAYGAGGTGYSWIVDLCSGGWVVAIILAFALCVPERRNPHD